MEVSLSKTGPNLDENCIKQVRKKQTCFFSHTFLGCIHIGQLRRILVIVVDICMVLSTLSISFHVRGL